MTKSSGLGDRLFVAEFDLSGDVGSIQRVGGGNSPLVVTGIDKQAFERLAGKLDGAINFMAFFNKTAGQAHPVLSALPTTDRIVSYLRGTTLGNAIASMVAKQINYDGNRAADGSLTFQTQALANGFGLEWGRQLTAGLRSDTTATNGASIDTVASAAFGLQAYLHVISFTGTSVSIQIEDSADNAAFADVTAGTFTSVTAPTSERLFTARNATIRQYLRIATVGTFSQCSFVVNVVKNTATTVF
ncbi:MAG: hypothetical protein WD064_03020 [Acidimicrobiia bacterium]